jgi:hypothetical protein
MVSVKVLSGSPRQWRWTAEQEKVMVLETEILKKAL